MKELNRLMERFTATCRKAHEHMTEDRWGPGMNRFGKLSEIARRILAAGDEGGARLFALVEGDDYLLAIHAVDYVYNLDQGRCERALRRIMKQDNGFFGHGARMSIEIHKHGMDWMMDKYMRRLPGSGKPRRLNS